MAMAHDGSAVARSHRGTDRGDDVSVIVGEVALWLTVIAGVAAALSSVVANVAASAPATATATAPATAQWTGGQVAQRLQELGVFGGIVALVALVRAFLISDWSSRYVADHTRSGLSPLLRLAGLWAGPEGSLLLFSVGVSVVALIASSSTRSQPVSVQRMTRAIGASVSTGFALVVLLTASPFVRLPIPAIDGLGLQPVLEHPAMVWHPPLLYAGLVGMLLPSFVAAGQLLGGGSLINRVSRPMLAVPAGLLAAGLATGARWAHVELGWGGYWAWDPIESAGLVAWLAAVAALHLPRATDHRVLAGALLAPGVAAIWATTLTRVGLVDSVHAFADRPALRTALLAVAVLSTALLLAPIGRSSATGEEQTESIGRRSGAAVLTVATLLVAVGTYEPLIEAGIGGDALSVAGWFFARALWPVVIVGGAAIVMTERARWWPALGAVVALALTPLVAGPFALAVAAAGGSVVAAAIASPHRSTGRLAHIGAGILLIGVAGTMATSVQAVVLFPDQPVMIDGRMLVHRGIELETGPVTSRAIAHVDVDGNRLEPSLVKHERRGVSTAEVVTVMGASGEFQIVLLNGDDISADYRIVSHPRMALVWIGAMLVSLGLLGGRANRYRSRSSRFRLRS